MPTKTVVISQCHNVNLELMVLCIYFASHTFFVHLLLNILLMLNV